MRWKIRRSSPCWPRWSTAATGSLRTDPRCPVAAAPYRAYGPGSGIVYRTAYIARWRLTPYRAYGRAPGLCTAPHILPGGGSRLTGPTVPAPGLCTAPHILPGGGSRLTGPTVRARNYVAHRIYCPVAAHALPGLRVNVVRLCRPGGVLRLTRPSVRLRALNGNAPPGPAPTDPTAIG
jgi:hypothetical protein